MWKWFFGFGAVWFMGLGMYVRGGDYDTLSLFVSLILGWVSLATFAVISTIEKGKQ